VKELAGIAWHQLPAAEVAGVLECNPAIGLTQDEVEARLRAFGSNQMTARKRLSEWMRFLLQFHQPLIYILLAATVITLALGEWVDASVIFGVVFVNAVIGYLQEAKAGKAIDALAKMVVTEAMVRRGGKKLRIPSAQLVPGDVVLLQSGDRVPADMRLLRRRNLQIEEAALTGESVPVEKQAEPLPADAVLVDRTNLAFTGTLVT
jgi:cation-transporting ATPase F